MEVKKMSKDFNKNVEEFEKGIANRESLIQNLQILSVTNDLSVFDTSNYEGTQFYINLYSLLTHHSTDPELVWSIINVLSTAVNNPSARSALVHTFHFIHPLTSLLDSQLTSQKKSILLNIMQELSYGIVISWQEAHLPKLIGLLVDMIMEEEDDLIPLALGVLINLCHKNKPAIFTLMNRADIKAFIRKIINLQRDNVETSVQVCKLLMVLDSLSGNVPDEEILQFVQVSFIRINKAFTCGNSFLMRHIVNFFRDARESDHGRKVLLTYPKYQEEVNKLITSLKSKEQPEDWQCVQLLVDFMRQLINLELVALIPLFTKLLQCLLCWVQVDSVAPSVLELYAAMFHQSRISDEQEYKNMCSCVQNHLQMFVEMLHMGCKSDLTKNEDQDILIGLLHLFHELTENSDICSNMSSDIDKELVKNLFLPLLSQSSSDASRMFQHPLTVLYVEVLSFVSELSQDDKEWLFLYSDLLHKKQILKILAIALHSGSAEVKKQTLILAGTTSFSNECLTGLSKFLTDLNQLYLMSSTNPSVESQDLRVQNSISQVDYLPALTNQQSCSLNKLIGKLEDVLAKDKIEDVSLSGIIELYNYKLCEMRRAEKALQSSLEAADRHRTHLSHRVAQLTAETGRLHQLLYTGQQTIEGCEQETAKLREQLKAAHESASSTHIKFKQLNQDVRSKNMIIKDQTDEISKMKTFIKELERNIADLQDKIEQQTQTIQNLETDKSDLHKSLTKLEEKFKNKEQTILEKEMIIEKKSSQVQTLEQEISKQLGLIKGHEKMIKEKEKEIGLLKKELQDLERTRKLIFEISGGKKTNL